MANARELEQRRQALLKQLGEVGTLRKGCLNEQWFAVVREGKKTKELRGPYFVWTHKSGKKTVSKRVRGAAALERARRDAASYKRFKELCREYEAVAQRLGELEREEGAELERLKKGLKSRSNKRRR
jgi:flagellar motility protein MotE (MotC chaperone)